VDTVETTQKVKNPVIDFVVTPKGGSPILGYEFSKLMNKPFVLHEENARFDSVRDDMRKWFDCASVPPRGSRALIVDDSTTGGRMVLKVITDLKKYGYKVTECLVVFEPQNKDAAKKLSDQGVNLISIVKTHVE
jgi:orotate phosphoribosyltransferase